MGGRECVEQSGDFRGVLLVPERELFVARLNGEIVGSAILARPPRNNEAQAFAASLMHSYIAPYARALLGAVTTFGALELLTFGWFSIALSDPLGIMVRLVGTGVAAILGFGWRRWGLHARVSRWIG